MDLQDANAVQIENVPVDVTFVAPSALPYENLSLGELLFRTLRSTPLILSLQGFYSPQRKSFGQIPRG